MEIDCDHRFKDVTKKRRSLIAKSVLPGWVTVLIEKEDPKWVVENELWKTLKYEKCANCGLLRITDQPSGE